MMTYLKNVYFKFFAGRRNARVFNMVFHGHVLCTGTNFLGAEFLHILLKISDYKN